jgi:hypothetical protein
MVVIDVLEPPATSIFSIYVVSVKAADWTASQPEDNNVLKTVIFWDITPFSHFRVSSFGGDMSRTSSGSK